jgi:hypothetical protein
MEIIMLALVFALSIATWLLFKLVAALEKRS